MRSGWLRQRSRVVASLLLLVSLWQLPHRWQDDEACAPVPAEAHDESKHVFTAPAAADHDDHCAVCHWTRWLKPVFASTTTALSPRGAGRDFAPHAPDSLRDPASDRLPPRAPPTAG